MIYLSELLKFQNIEINEIPLNCAWCDIPPTIAGFTKGRGYSIMCSNLLNCAVCAETKLFKTIQLAINSWNTRK